MPLWNKGKSKGKDWLDAHIGFDGPDCLIWPFAKNRGYGQFGLNNKMHKAHRVMCEMINGPAPPDKPQAAHTCGNGHLGCVHPRHLVWASQSENHADRLRHGTAATNKYGSRTRLDHGKIAWMRSVKGAISPYEVARRLKISEGTARRWMKSTHEPAKFSTDPQNIKRRASRPSRSISAVNK